jgi:hypothetical protein
LKASVRVLAMSSGSESFVCWMLAAFSKAAPASRSGGEAILSVKGLEGFVCC